MDDSVKRAVSKQVCETFRRTNWLNDSSDDCLRGPTWPPEWFSKVPRYTPLTFNLFRTKWRPTVFIVTRIKTTAVENEDGELEAVKTLDDAHIETDAKDIIQRVMLGDDRVKGIRVFEMTVDDEGVPQIVGEVTQ